MSRAALPLLVAAALAAGCGKNTLRAAEGHYCSTDPDEDPQQVCSPAYDLVCISTFDVLVTNPKEAAKFDGGVRDVWLCRLFCEPGGQCPGPTDVCCPGRIYGNDYGGKTHACVPAPLCRSYMGPDAAVRPRPEAGADGAADGGAPDAPVDGAVDGGQP